MMKLTVQQSIEEAKKDPNSDFATQIREMIESGQLDDAAQRQGFDLIPYGRPQHQKVETAEDMQQMLQRSGERLGTAGQRFTESAQRFTEDKGGVELTTDIIGGLANNPFSAQGIMPNILQALTSKDQTFAETALQTGGEAITAGQDVAFEGVTGLARSVMTPEQETKANEKIASALAPIAPMVEKLQTQLTELEETNPQAAANLRGTLGFLEIAPIPPAGKLLSKTGGAISDATKAISEAITNLLPKGDFLRRSEMPSVELAIETPTMKSILDDPKTGKTVENVGKIQSEIVGVENLLTVPDKKRLLDIEPELGDKYLDALKQTEVDDTAGSIFDVAVDDTLDAMNTYKKNTSTVGSDIGKIKDKLKGLDTPKEGLVDISDSIKGTLKAKGLEFVDGRFQVKPGSNTPFSKTDIKAINDEIVLALNNVQESGSMEQLLLAIESLDNKINFSKSDTVTGSLQGISKKVRANLKEIRDAALTPEEALRFDEFAQAKTFMDEFFKSDNKVMTLLKRFQASNSKASLSFAKEIERVTGIDIMDYARLAQMLSETTAVTSRNRSLLRQYMGDATKDILTLSPTGLGRSTLEALGRTFINVDKLDEIKKALKVKSSRVKKDFNKGAVPQTVNMDNPMANEVIATLESGELSLNKAGEVVEAGVDDLVSQAKKFDSAEEFIGAQGDILYHGTSAPDFSEFKGVTYLTKDPKEAQSFAKGLHLGGSSGGKERVMEVIPNLKKTKNIDVMEYVMEGDLDEGIAIELKKAKKEGFDSIAFEHPSNYSDGEFMAVVPIENINIKTKSQLTDIWNKANSKTNLTTEAKKYGSADEFVKAQPKLYHRTDVEFDEFDTSLDPDDGFGTWFASSKQSLEESASAYPILMERVPHKKLKLIDEDSLSKLENTEEWLDSELSLSAFLKEKGFDGVDYGEGIVQIIDPNDLKTKSQLEDIWKQANKSNANLPKSFKKGAVPKTAKKTDRIIAFHGQLENQPVIKSVRGRYGEGFYVTDTRESAEYFGSQRYSNGGRETVEGATPKVGEFDITDMNIKKFTDDSQWEADLIKELEVDDSFFPDRDAVDDYHEILKKQGYDGVQPTKGETIIFKESFSKILDVNQANN